MVQHGNRYCVAVTFFISCSWQITSMLLMGCYAWNFLCDTNTSSKIAGFVEQNDWLKNHTYNISKFSRVFNCTALLKLSLEASFTLLEEAVGRQSIMSLSVLQCACPESPSANELSLISSPLASCIFSSADVSEHAVQGTVEALFLPPYKEESLARVLPEIFKR